MTDGFPDRLTQLRNRWQADPSSRVFLQLAEEYRHLGRVRDALEVLDAGLKEHPGYLSALVAKGRCHLELGEADLARTVLERVVQQDATQMVANKLLVRAYLEVADVDRARQRLDLYSLLNDSDPEVEELRRRIAALNRPPQAATERPRVDGLNDDPQLKKLLEDSRSSAPAPRRERPPPDEPHGADALDATTPRFARSDVFDLDHEPLPARQKTDVFDLDLVAAAVASRAPAVAPPPHLDEPFDLAPLALAARPATDGDDPFPDLAPRNLRQRYLDSLTGEGIFSWDDLPAAPAAAAVRQEIPAPPSQPVRAEPLAPPAPPVQVAAEVRPPEPLSLPEELPVPPWSAAPEPLAALEAIALDEPAAPSPAWEDRPEEPWPSVPELPAVPPMPPMPPLAAAAIEPEGPTAATATAPLAEDLTATATLGELYLRQGHVQEAERIFRELLEREPGNAAVRAALERSEQSPPRELDPRRLLEGFDPDAIEGTAADLLRARKVHFLNTYLQRLRQADHANVP